MAVRAVWRLVLAVAVVASPAASAKRHLGEAIPKFTGTVSAANAVKLLDAVSDRTDKLVGLQVYVEPSSDKTFSKTHYIASVDGGQFVLSKSEGNGGGGIEMVAPATEARWEHGGYVLDGFYLVKSGGLHQGIISVGLEKLRESDVLLSKKFRVILKPLSRSSPASVR